MGILNSLFGKSSQSKETHPLAWNELVSLEQLDEIITASQTKPQLIFKHSTRCGISSMVLNQFNRDFDVQESKVDIHYLDILNYRKVSNEIGKRFFVIHESPQILVIKNGIAVANASHGAINEIDLDRII